MQGVGFRPFVHGLARRCGVAGDVCNSSRGVFINVFGEREAVETFVEALRTSQPPLASVTEVSARDIPWEERRSFRIVPSKREPDRTVAVTPDACICADCRRELLDPADRRHRYPFINCTNCGPRYSIILDVPYDRCNTTMRAFEMCPACRVEYEEPTDRRYHAQPNCCAKCGPRLQMLDGAGRALDCDPVVHCAALIRDGLTVAIKGLGGFHLTCDATNEAAVRRLRERKRREEKPLAVMAANFELASRLVHMPDYAERLLTSPVSPILIAPRRLPEALAPSVAPINDYYGVMLPYTPLHVLLFEEGLEYLVMTSGNLTDEPICIDNAEAVGRLAGVADAFLVHDRPINLRVDDSVLTATEGQPTVIRRARGYVPRGIETGLDVDGLAAFGPMLKNTLAIGRGTVIYPGQHVGDLNNKAALDMFHEVYDHLRAILGVEVRKVACDLHPDYPTTGLAERSGLEVVRVQHHHAHLVSLMAEKRVYERSIGIALDGTGYGDDGEIWGGEVLVFDARSYRRAYHLEYVPLPGGDRAAQEPWRMALAYLLQNGLDHERHVRQENAPQVAALLRSEVRMYRTSSTGRMFDAVASLCGLCHYSIYEAKAPMALEGVARDTGDCYDFALQDGVIRTGEVIRGVVRDVEDNVPVATISGRFHNTVVAMMSACARAIRESEGINRVFLSGGCFVNAYLTAHGRRALEDDGFDVYTHTLLPPNDGGVSVGQLLAAAARQTDASHLRSS